MGWFGGDRWDFRPWFLATQCRANIDGKGFLTELSAAFLLPACRLPACCHLNLQRISCSEFATQYLPLTAPKLSIQAPDYNNTDKIQLSSKPPYFNYIDDVCQHSTDLPCWAGD
jgi:hypothetical protein